MTNKQKLAKLNEAALDPNHPEHLNARDVIARLKVEDMERKERFRINKAITKFQKATRKYKNNQNKKWIN